MAVQACNKQLDAFVGGLAGEKEKPAIQNKSRAAQAKPKKAEAPVVQKDHSTHKYCLAGVCIGDGIEKMDKHQWVAIDKELKDNAVKNRRYNKARYKASDRTLKVLAPYIMINKFDKTALNQLDNLNAVCEPMYLDGGFYTKSKYFINVTLSAVPQKDGSHEFQVTELVEDFRGITSESKREIEAIETKLRSQFPDVVTDKNTRDNPLFKVWEHWVYFKNIYTDFAGASVSATIRDPGGFYKGDGSVEDALMKNPKCKVSVSLD